MVLTEFTRPGNRTFLSAQSDYVRPPMRSNRYLVIAGLAGLLAACTSTSGDDTVTADSGVRDSAVRDSAVDGALDGAVIDAALPIDAAIPDARVIDARVT